MPDVSRRLLASALLAVLPGCSSLQLRASDAVSAGRYDIVIDDQRPYLADVRLALPASADTLHVARDGDGSQIDAVRCADGRTLARTETGWRIPAGCGSVHWRVVLDAIDGQGLDASLPRAAASRRHLYWVLPERAALLRATDDGGRVRVTVRRGNGGSIQRQYALPSNLQPPLYAVIGDRPSARYRRHGFALNVYGAAPAFPWMDAVHGHVLATWARWRRDLVTGDAPARIDWAWIEPAARLEPGYNASAGAQAILSQIRLRPDDPDAEAKARAIIAASAAHEGFHTITGAAGQGWPAWVNESLANHFAIEAAREFLAPEDFRFLRMFYIDTIEARPLLAAQAAYLAGDGGQAQLFYTYGAHFWRDIEAVLTSPANSSGRLAALIKASENFKGIDMNDAGALGAFLDRHSDGRARPIVNCYLLGQDCPATPTPKMPGRQR